MTHWEYPEAVERFDRILQRLGISAELERQGAVDGDLVMVGDYDFDFSPGFTNPYIPAELLEQDALWEQRQNGIETIIEDSDQEWRPFRLGGYLDEDSEELVGFNDDDEWSLLEEEESEDAPITGFFPSSLGASEGQALRVE
jgi:GTP-binding protein